MNETENIVACSSGTGVNVAVSIIRVSGADYLEDLAPFFSTNLLQIQPRVATVSKVLLGTKIIDEVVLLWFPNPNSYNGEDILEVHCHGNVINVQRILDLLCSTSKMRLAKPGEFTERALINKKMNLSQVEGLDLLLNANNIFALDQGLSLLRGELRESFYSLSKAYINHKSALELGFDFLDDVGDEAFNKNLEASFNSLRDIIIHLNKRVLSGSAQLIEPEIVLIGPPNAGKSTLFNLLLGTDRAIVTPTAGTTRDYISEDLYIDNYRFRLLDTAGLRETGDAIESQGIERALKLAENAFFKILLFNPNDKYSFKQFEDMDFDLCLLTHSTENYLGGNDELDKKLTAPIGPLREDGSIGPICVVDLLDTPRIDLIQQEISHKYLKLLSFDPIIISRHIESIKKIERTFDQYRSIFSQEQDLAVLASEFSTVGVCISELVGIVSAEDVLENIFNNFCIGK